MFPYILLQVESPLDPTTNTISLAVMLVAFLIAGILSGAGITALLAAAKRDKAFLDTAEKLYESLPIDAHRDLVNHVLEIADSVTDAIKVVGESNSGLNEAITAIDDAVDVLIKITDGLPNDETVTLNDVQE